MTDRLFQIKFIWHDLETGQQRVRQKPMPIRIGRREDSDVSITEPTVSRTHASLQLVDGEIHLIDHSSYGTIVDGALLHNAQKILQHKASFQIADCIFRLRHQPRQVRCHHCAHVVSLHKRNCSICGRALTGAGTIPYVAAELTIESQGSKCHVR